MNLKTGSGKISVTDAQAQRLGLRGDADNVPVRIGCGESGCAYESVQAGTVVKLTRDPSDALGCWLLSKLDRRLVEWSVPVLAVHRVEKGFAIIAARCELLTPEWAEPIDALYELAQDEDLDPEDWPGARDACLREIEWKEAEHRGATAADRRMRAGLEVVDQAVRGLVELGFDWHDWHSDNWGMLEGRPVLTDLGLLHPRGGATIEKRAREIPVLPY